MSIAHDPIAATAIAAIQAAVRKRPPARRLTVALPDQPAAPEPR